MVSRNYESRGSAKERVPGALFRAMACLYLKKFPGTSRGALARELGRRLVLSGIAYHERTLKRQIRGDIESVPGAVEALMRRLLIESDGLRTEGDIEKALHDSGLQVPRSRRVSRRLPAERILPLARLWLYLNPGRSRRRLAERLHRDLPWEGGGLGINFLQAILSGRAGTVRRELKEKLLEYLGECGVRSEDEALALCRREEEGILRSLKGREFTDLRRFVRLCRLWQVLRREPSSRRLASRLREEMARRGVPLSLHHFQELVDGKLRRVRGAILEAMEGLLRKELGSRDVEEEIEKVSCEPARLADLGWVRVEPIAMMAREWASNHPGASMRRLAFQVARSVRRMGYSAGISTLQPILGGRKKKTRGFIYRAVMRQLGRGSRIPEEHRVRSSRGIEAAAWGDETLLRRISRVISRSGDLPRPALGDYLRIARRCLGKPGHSPHLGSFLALRIEKAYKIPRRRVADLLRSREAMDRDPQGAAGESFARDDSAGGES